MTSISSECISSFIIIIIIITTIIVSIDCYMIQKKNTPMSEYIIGALKTL